MNMTHQLTRIVCRQLVLANRLSCAAYAAKNTYQKVNDYFNLSLMILSVKLINSQGQFLNQFNNTNIIWERRYCFIPDII